MKGLIPNEDKQRQKTLDERKRNQYNKTIANPNKKKRKIVKEQQVSSLLGQTPNCQGAPREKSIISKEKTSQKETMIIINFTCSDQYMKMQSNLCGNRQKQCNTNGAEIVFQ